MLKQTLKQLLEEAEKKVIDYGNEIGQAFSLKLEVSLAHDYCWQATAVMHKGDLETGETVETKSYGQTPEEALNSLIKKLSDKEYIKTPVCQLCGAQNPTDEFVPACWLQIATEEPYNQHGDKIIWVCPDCITKKANAN